MGSVKVLRGRCSRSLDQAVRGVVAGLLVLLPVLVLPVRSPAADPPVERARAILDHVDDLFQGDASHGRATMTVVTRHWTRALTIESWNRGKDRALLRILEPEKEKGTATLKVGKDLWNYLPKVKRVIKLPSSMMSAGWMGSHFTNDDLVKESRMTEDYTFAITFEGARDGADVVEITCKPKEEAAVVWGKVVVVVRRADGLPLRILFYDEDLRLSRTMIYSEIRDLGGRQLPSHLEMLPADKPGESTSFVYEEIQFDPPIADDMFSIRALQE